MKCIQGIKQANRKTISLSNNSWSILWKSKWASNTYFLHKNQAASLDLEEYYLRHLETKMAFTFKRKHLRTFHRCLWQTKTNREIRLKQHITPSVYLQRAGNSIQRWETVYKEGLSLTFSLGILPVDRVSYLKGKYLHNHLSHVQRAVYVSAYAWRIPIYLWSIHSIKRVIFSFSVLIYIFVLKLKLPFREEAMDLKVLVFISIQGSLIQTADTSVQKRPISVLLVTSFDIKFQFDYSMESGRGN